MRKAPLTKQLCHVLAVCRRPNPGGQLDCPRADEKDGVRTDVRTIFNLLVNSVVKRGERESKHHCLRLLKCKTSFEYKVINVNIFSGSIGCDGNVA